MMSGRDRLSLVHGWRVTRHSPSDPEARWIPVESVPTVVHLDLMGLPSNHPEQIDDPFFDLNEFDARWVADTRWTYECRFPSPEYIAPEYTAGGEQQAPTISLEGIQDGDGEAEDCHDAEHEKKTSEKNLRTTDLVFKGLDTLTTVTLNGIHILDTDNMFTEYIVDVTDQLLVGPDAYNVLLIRFDPARLAGLRQVSHGTRHECHVHQTEVGRAAIRKAQYQWGWDWGPVLNTAGPWQPIFLDSYDYCIDKIRIWTHLSDDLTEGKVTVNVAISGKVPSAQLRAEIRSPSGEKVAEAVKTIDIDQTKSGQNVNLDFEIAAPNLWWPATYGRQDMYVVKLTLQQVNGESVDSTAKRFAFRRSKLIQQPDKLGTSFYFQINNVDIFSGGSCWIPADSFLRATDYNRWMDLLVDGHQIMIRVWGGGIYESDYFYDACDERGLLVWQDFAFACASYPANDDKFLRSVEVEARQNVARLQRHPSLVVWAGNNEDYQIKEHYDVQYDPTSMGPHSWLKTKFPARYIYEYMLPDIVLEGYGVHEGAQAVPYQPGSPYGDARSTTLKVDPSIGDIHQWDVWHGAMRHYQEYPFMSGRFVSEFGMQAYPHFDTLSRTISGGDKEGKNSQLWPGSVTMDVRNKATGHQFRLLKYVAENFRIHELDDTVSFGHLTQVMQADAVAHAYRGWRRLWRKRLCGGALIWQLNDCWPTISWSVVDYYGVPKPAFYAIKRALAPLAIAVQRNFHDWTTRRAGDGWQRDTGHVEPQLSSVVQYNVWIASSRLKEENDCRTVVRFISIATGRDVVPKIEIRHSVQANTTTPILTNRYMLSGEQKADEQADDEQVEEDIPEQQAGGHGTNDFVYESESRNSNETRHSSASGSIAVHDTEGYSRNDSKGYSDFGSTPSLGNGTGSKYAEVGCSSNLLRALDPCVIFASLYTGGADDIVSSDTSWPDPIKYLEFHNRQVKINTHQMLPGVLTGTVTVTADKPVKGFVFTEKVGGLEFSDNGFDVMPGEIHLIIVKRVTAKDPWPLLEYTYVGRDIWRDEFPETGEV